MSITLCITRPDTWLDSFLSAKKSGYGPTDGRTDKQIDGWTNRRTDGWTDTTSYRVMAHRYAMDRPRMRSTDVPVCNDMSFMTR